MLIMRSVKCIAMFALMIFACNMSAQVKSVITSPSNGLLLAVVRGDSVISAEEYSGFISENIMYNCYNINSFLGTYEGKSPVEGIEICTGTWEVDFEDYPYDYPNIIGINCSWDPFPKTLKLTSVTQQNYIQITSDVLKENGIEDPVVEITAIIRTDLENDGVEEVIVSAFHSADGLGGHVSKGDYSIIYLRKIIDGVVNNIPIIYDLHAEADEYNIGFSLDVAAILDIDGDGVYEIITHDRYYEGWGNSIYKWEDGDVRFVTSTGCGA